MAMMSGGFGPMLSWRRDESVTKQRLRPGTVRRIARYARPYTRQIAAFLALVVAGAVIVVANPLLMKAIIDDGILTRRTGVVIGLAVAIAALAVVDAGLTLAQRWFSARIGEGLIYDLRTEVFDHVQRMPVAFFMRAQTGALVSRLNTDVCRSRWRGSTRCLSTAATVAAAAEELPITASRWRFGSGRTCHPVWTGLSLCDITTSPAGVLSCPA
jgi:ATP-binding cassette subfamily B protein